MFVLVLALGSAGIAVWFAYRFPALAPSGMPVLLCHVGAAFALSQLGSFVLSATLAPENQTRSLAALFGVALPVLVYCFLVGFWIARMTHDVFSRAAR